jgi:23S rRNA (cytosine1962-C5)-methyltransferase
MIELFSSTYWEDYELLDSGNSLKLERFGPYRFVRQEHQAVWKPAFSPKEWERADAVFLPTSEESGGKWQFNRHIKPQWEMHYKDLSWLERAIPGIWVYFQSKQHIGIGFENKLTYITNQ